MFLQGLTIPQGKLASVFALNYRTLVLGLTGASINLCLTQMLAVANFLSDQVSDFVGLVSLSREQPGSK